MSNDLIEMDGFDGFESGYVDAGDSYSGNILSGTIRLNFTNDAKWIEAVSKELVPPGLMLLVIDEARVVIRFKDKKPEQRVLAPGEKFPDLKALNDAVPKSEWRTDLNGNLVGPWQAQHVLFFLDEKTLDRYSWPTSTTGGTICVEQIVDKVRWMRRYRGERVVPVVQLADTFMKTRYGGASGGRQRPHLIIKRWIRLGGGPELRAPAPVPDKPPPLTDSPSVAPSSATPVAPTSPTVAPVPQTVSEPSLSEDLNDAIPFRTGSADESGRTASALPVQKDNPIEELLDK